MIKLKKSVSFDPKTNRMKVVTDVVKALNDFKTGKNKNLEFLLSKRFAWMNKFIYEADHGFEVGSGAGFLKNLLKIKILN